MYRRSLLAAPFLAAPLAARAQSPFSEKPIRMIVPVAAAGASDIVARMVANAMSPLLGRPIVVENLAGAGSTLGANAFQQTPADGQTIYVPTNNHALMKLIYPQFAYDPVADFAPVALVSRQPFVLAVHSSVPANSVPEFVAWLRQKGTAANCGASAPGAANYMAAELFRHFPEVGELTADGQEVWYFRLCGLGIFHDPNDLSLLIAVTAIIAAYFLLDVRNGASRWLWLIPLLVMVTAYYFTFSRGGLLALGFAGVVWLAARYGGRVAVGLGVLGMAALPVALGRHASMNLSEGTGQERIQIWSEGLVQLKTFRGLFGIGEGMYPDLAGLVAHNSYVHSFVELGVFGGAIFFGCFYFPAYALYRIKRDPIAIEHPELERMLPYIAAILAAWCMGMASLSRCYVAPTYMVVGVCAAYLNLVGYHREAPRPLQTLNWLGIRRWAACSAALLMCCFLFVKLFARYSG